MSYEKSWSFAINTLPTDQTTLTNQMRSFLLQLKNFLKNTAGWTVAYSSNGTVANTSDNWTTLSDLVRATAGTAHSHITLISPAGMRAGADGSYTGDQSKVALILDWSTASDHTVNIRVGLTASPTGGSVTTAQSIGATLYAYSNQQILRSTLAANAYFHFACTSQGAFWAGVSFASAGRMSFFCLFTTLVDSSKNATNLDHPYNCASYSLWSDTGTGASSLGSQTSGWGAWSPTGAGEGGWNMSLSSSSNIIGVGGGAGGDTWAYKALNSPIYICSNTTGTLAGRIPDFFVTGNTSLPNGAANVPTMTHVLSAGAFIPSNQPINW